MSDEERLEEIMNDLESYFQYAMPYGDYNVRLAQPYIAKWGAVFLHMSLAWFVATMKEVAARTLIEPPLEQTYDETIREVAISTIRYTLNLAQAYGSQGPAHLCQVITQATDEDTITLASFLLSSRDFTDRSYRDMFWTAYRKAEGTACKIALAYALFVIGEKSELQGYVNKGYFGTQNAINKLKAMLIANANVKRHEIDDMVMTAILFPYTLPIPLPMNVFLGVLGIIALDMATEGIPFYHLPWKRKQYP